ncbi:unnamed protein product [Prorocentrum cordatum]|uniref:Uncharacterized protein n=1 Tax=Prorocentrum cordatum TaxID=2364126 RepID=A0ABN9YET4_9DINO|nr:unnamed protein product [Polarella glacialis]
MREGHGTRGPRGMDTMGEAGERGQKKAVRYPCSAIVGPVAAGGPPGETHRGRLRGLRHWAAGCSGASAALCARGQAPRLGGRRSSAAQGAAARMARGQRAVRRAGTCAAKGAVGRPMRGAGRRLWGPWPTLGP